MRSHLYNIVAILLSRYCVKNGVMISPSISPMMFSPSIYAVLSRIFKSIEILCCMLQYSLKISEYNFKDSPVLI